MHVPNLHIAPKRHLIKIRTFLKKVESHLENDSDSTKLFEILHSNKTPNKLSNRQLKLAFKHPNFVHEPF